MLYLGGDCMSHELGNAWTACTQPPAGAAAPACVLDTRIYGRIKYYRIGSFLAS